MGREGHASCHDLYNVQFLQSLIHMGISSCAFKIWQSIKHRFLLFNVVVMGGWAMSCSLNHIPMATVQLTR